MIISKLKKENIFCDEYSNLISHNKIDIEHCKIAVIYGPNGTGKSSLASILNNESGTQYTISYGKKIYSETNHLPVHVIKDQNGRNIITGSTEDFILGENIRHEYELKRQLDEGFNILYESLTSILKNEFKISTKTSLLISFIENQFLKDCITNIINNKQKGRNIDKGLFLKTYTNKPITEDIDINKDKLSFILDDLKNKNSCIQNLLNIGEDNLNQDLNYQKVEETTDALYILKKYNTSTNCIVCDHDIHYQILFKNKQNQNLKASEALSEQTKQIVQNILELISTNDPFHIKITLSELLKTGNKEEMKNLIQEIKNYLVFCNQSLEKLFITKVTDSALLAIYSEYNDILSAKPEFEEEDILFIEKFLNNCLDREITLDRDLEKNIKLFLGNEEFLEKDRKSLMLSNGEQNFLSLAFELLKAKKIPEKIIVLDDPISSFDSIYKNKIVYAITKFLDNKEVICLTHSTELIKLLEHQRHNCFNLYYMNNTAGEENGFIKILPAETQLLINIPKLISFFKNEISNIIYDKRLFLISCIPFMRGYSKLIGKEYIYKRLTKLMHGYENKKYDISKIYNTLFNTTIIQDKYEISNSDILSLRLDDTTKILDGSEYPLLEKTMIHTLNYLYLRMLTEHTIVTKYNITITDKLYQLSQIIREAFSSESKSDIENRVFFLSKKSLLNEFNHFEADFNFYQPAIDITNTSLKTERESIMEKLNLL